MGQESTVTTFIEHDLKAGNVIEPARRRAAVTEKLLSAVKTHAPSVVVKIGVGEGSLACALAEKVKKLVVIDPSFEALALFAQNHASTPGFKKIELVNGTPEALPVDFYKADMVVVVDYLDLFDSYRVIDEILRGLRYEGMLFFGGLVLSNEDVEGIYDEFVHAANPYHNDYYLQSDLDTFMKIKEFTPVSQDLFRTKISLSSWLSGWEPFAARGSDLKAARDVITGNAALFSSLYGWDGNDQLDEIFCTAVYRKNAYKPNDGKI